MYLLIRLLQDIDIEEKLQSAPDDQYVIGVVIGSLLPLVVLVAIAFAIHHYKKNRYKDF